jgi:transcriptional regulator with XRE-family HTH domain
MTKTVVAQFTETPEGLRLFQQERLATEVTELICRTMKDRRIKRSQLADMLHKTKGRVSQILNGNQRNLTLRTVSDIFTALGKMMVVSAKDISIEEERLPTISMAFDVSSWPMPAHVWELPDLIERHSDKFVPLAS